MTSGELQLNEDQSEILRKLEKVPLEFSDGTKYFVSTDDPMKPEWCRVTLRMNEWVVTRFQIGEEGDTVTTYSHGRDNRNSMEATPPVTSGILPLTPKEFLNVLKAIVSSTKLKSSLTP